MARTKLLSTANDLISDSGNVLWSLVKGEQLEFPVLIDFLDPTQVVDNYTFEAVVVEADNVLDQTEKPSYVKAGGVQTVLTVRKPNLIGAWDSATAYNYENFVTYSGKVYKLLNGVARVSATLPTVDPLWEETTLNRVYIQFPTTLASTWVVQPNVLSDVYGFIELRVTEPNNSILQRTWKPIRGMVQIGYSPTDVVA